MTPPGWSIARIAVRRIWAILPLASLLAALAAATIQTARLEGFHVWPITVTGWIKTASDRQKIIDRMTSAQDEAAQAARAQRLDQEAHYRAIAERIDDNAQDTLEAAMAAADRFIAAGGMRSQAAGNPRCSAGTGAGDSSAEDIGRTGRATQLDAGGDRLAAGPAADLAEGFVIVSAEDIRICTRNTIKAEAGHQLATQLQAASRNATPAPPVAAGRQDNKGKSAHLAGQ